MEKITVFIITYNQEKEIKRAIDSILQQKEWGLFKIVVNDDCSPDNTWEVLQGYKQRYPNLMELHRNEHNLGIYGNMAKIHTLLPDSDLYVSLSGDDAFCAGYFEGVQKLINLNNIDTNEAVGIYSDWKSVYPDGNEKVFKQNVILSGCRLWSLKARGFISIRGLIVSKQVIDAYEPILDGYGLNLTESHYDSQAHLNIKKAYYLPQVSSIYYSGIGVSSKLSLKKSDYYTKQNIEKWNYGIKHYVKDEKDLHYGTFEILKSQFYIKPSIIRFLKMLYHYNKGQLPKCRIPINKTIRTFLGLIKYSIIRY